MKSKVRLQEALDFHESKPKGKIEVTPTKPLNSQRDLALAYSPGVAEPCLAISKNNEDIYKYTAKGNLVAVITNGTAVLGLGDIGAGASKPVMEGKGVLFKKFAGIDVFDIEIDENDPDKFVQIVTALEPTFGGVNLEDIKAPESFKIESDLKEKMNIPVMHDDQHGTAIISSAALLNALQINKKNIEEIKIVVSGAGGAAIACTNLYISLGAKRENIIMTDSKGVIRRDRPRLSSSKMPFATSLDVYDLDDALDGADMFLGLSVANILKPEVLKKMANDPIVFALANPDPEIAYDKAIAIRKDIIMATGRSDHPNQVNNVLGFPYIFRGALDVRSTTINEPMKLAAVKALAELANQPVPQIVLKAYGQKELKFGRNYLIPKPFDPRLITSVSPAVAKAAMSTGVAKSSIKDWKAYNNELLDRVGTDNRLITRIVEMACREPREVVFAEADDLVVLQAAQMSVDEGVAKPILLGDEDKIRNLISENKLELGEPTIIDPKKDRDRVEKYSKKLFERRHRKGINMRNAKRQMRNRTCFGCMMVELGEADALISGRSNDYPETIRPALQIIGTRQNINRVAGLYIVSNEKGNYFFADTSINLNPTAEELVEIIGLTATAVQNFDYEPRIACLTYSNFGSSKGESPEKMAKAVRLAKEKWPELIIEGDLQANTALDHELIQENYPFNNLGNKAANTLIFPNLDSGNIAYKLLMELGGAEAIGPIVMGLNKSVHVLQQGISAREVFNMVAIAVLDSSNNHLIS